ncbi:MAG: FKBP-type peptidyl-prolyl cis-trans isomerase [Candidatus Paceibacterota bacterium]|jgi:FKBP-type peptidyl-prolyl cis-trans isomerase
MGNKKENIISIISVLVILAIVVLVFYLFSKEDKTKENKITETEVTNNINNNEENNNPMDTSEKEIIKGGVKIQILKEGSGEGAKIGQSVSVQYTGWLENGVKFDSSLDNDDGKPFSFPLGAGYVIKGWDIGVEGMKIGEKRKLTIPSDLAYGPKGSGPIPPNATLIFDVELLAIK